MVNAKVKLTNAANGESFDLTTNNVGEFVRPALVPANYTISVSAPGFKTTQQPNIQLVAGERTGVNIVLTVGDTSVRR